MAPNLKHEIITANHYIIIIIIKIEINGILTRTIWAPISSSSGLVLSLKQLRSTSSQSTRMRMRYCSASVSHNCQSNEKKLKWTRVSINRVRSIHFDRKTAIFSEKKDSPNVGLEPTTLRLRVSCSTD